MADADRRGLAVSSFNGTWDLLDLGQDRTEDDELTMLLSAAASRWLWETEGGPDEHATGDWQVARVLAVLGAGALSLRFAERALGIVRDAGHAGWRLASAHEGVARAHAALGDAAARNTHVAAAELALAGEQDSESRQLVAGQLATVPEVLPAPAMPPVDEELA